MTASSPDTGPASIADRFARARARIADACRAADRDPAGVTLTAVTKTQPDAAVDQALAAGQRVFGENRVQEAQGRWASRRDVAGLELRLIGPLQTNKAAAALALFDVIETVDRDRLVEALAKAAGDRAPRVMIQVNVGAEPQKAGVAVADAGALIDLARSRGLNVEGLMCIPPADEDPAPHFARLAALAAENGLNQRSMGMSGDYEAAIRHGATHVRLGSALFGERNTPPGASIDGIVR